MKSIFVICGERETGKTFFLQRLVSHLAKAGYQPEGFCSLHDVMTDSYLIKNIKTGEKELLMTRITPLEKNPGQFQIREAGIRKGTNWIGKTKKSNSSILVMDEIGHFELQGKVWHELVSFAVKSMNPFIFTTKTKLLPGIIEKWSLHPAAVFYPPDFSSPEETAKQITEVLKLNEQNPRHKNNSI